MRMLSRAREIDLHLGILIKQPIKICIHLRPKVRGRVQDEILTLVQSRAIRVAMQHNKHITSIYHFKKYVSPTFRLCLFMFRQLEMYRRLEMISISISDIELPSSKVSEVKQTTKSQERARSRFLVVPKCSTVFPRDRWMGAALRRERRGYPGHDPASWCWSVSQVFITSECVLITASR